MALAWLVAGSLASARRTVAAAARLETARIGCAWRDVPRRRAASVGPVATAAAKGTVQEEYRELAGDRMSKEAAREYLRESGYAGKPVMLYDGVCNLCNGGVNVMLELDRKEEFQYAALQSRAGRALMVLADRDPNDLSTMLVVDGERCLDRSDAALFIARNIKTQPVLGALGFTAQILFPKFLRDLFYTHVVAKNRYNFFGKRDTCRLTNDGKEHLFLQ